MSVNLGVRASGWIGRGGLATGALLPWLLATGLVVAAEPDEEVGSTYARVRSVEHVLNVERPSEGEALAAAANAPLVPGDRIWTTAGRAEIELADSSIVFLDTDTRLELRNLADYDNRYERTNLLVLRQGAIRIDNRDSAEADNVFQIDTEAGSVYLLSGGSFRIEANAGETTVSCSSGVAEFSGDGGSVLVRSGQRTSVTIGAVPDEPRRFNTGRADDFDRYHDERLGAWVDDRHDAPEVQEVPVEVRPYVRELSSYGTWTTIAPYGVVWRPVITGTWSPYAHGTWAWYPTGWVWVSSDPWGWAPYRYGRWDYAAPVGWFWVPGRVWSGAWVSFAVSSTHVGWCPLNYWNRPVFHDAWIVSQPAVPAARLDPRGWQFVPVGRFGRAAIAAGGRVDHLPRGTEVVVTRRLPAPLQPRAVATHTEPASSLVDQVRRGRVALPAAMTSSGEPVSFRVQEQRRAIAAATPKPAPPRGKYAAPRSVPTGTIALPQATSQPPHARAPARPPADVTASRARQDALPLDAVPRRPGERPIPSHPQRNDAPPRNDAVHGEPQRNEPPRHDPAVGRLVGGARKAPPPAMAAAPAAPPPPPQPQSSTPETRPGRSQEPSQGARQPQHAPRVASPPARPVPPSQPPHAGGLPSESERRKNETKPNGKPAKPKEPEPDHSGDE
jgi:hypothetical protein